MASSKGKAQVPPPPNPESQASQQLCLCGHSHFISKCSGKRSGHPESNQGPSDACHRYSQMLCQLSYSRLIVHAIVPYQQLPIQPICSCCKPCPPPCSYHSSPVTVPEEAEEVLATSWHPSLCNSSQGAHFPGSSRPCQTRAPAWPWHSYDWAKRPRADLNRDRWIQSPEC